MIEHSSLIEQLKKTEKAQLLRQPPTIEKREGCKIIINDRSYLDFSSNDYLGLSGHSCFKKSFAKHYDSFGYGATSSHLVSGHCLYHQIFEEKLSDYLEAEAALLFTSGYAANLAIQQVLLNRQDVVYHDRLNHASLLDGTILAQAKLVRFPHLDYEALDRQIDKNTTKPKLIASDGLFSMDGDLANVNQLNKISKKNNCYLLIDEAHSFGILGNGKGLLSESNFTPNKQKIAVVTLGKALGCFGAAVVGDRIIIEALKQFAKSYIYTTASPALNALLCTESLQIIGSQEGDDLRQKLHQNILFFKGGLSEIGWQLLPSQSPIQALVTGSTEIALKLSEQLKEQGFWVPAIRPPTVPKNKSRLRITITAHQTKENINQLITSLYTLRKKYA